MKVGDLVRLAEDGQNLRAFMSGIIWKIELNPYLVERDGSQGSWYFVLAENGFLTHRMHNLEVISEAVAS